MTAVADARTLDLFSRFPLALVLVEASVATPRVNAAFGRLFDPRCLAQEPLAGLARSADPDWHTAQLAGRDGTPIRVRAQSLPVQGGMMLVIETMADGADHGRFEALHARIAELERLSSTDRLTGAWNRAHLDRVVEVELGRSLRSRQPLSLVLLDIDHFKRVNDVHGHQAGDAVLRELVTLLQSRIRAADLLFRWGGEEFVVLAPLIGYRGAEVLAESLRGAVEAHAFPAVGRLTISAGVAEYAGAEGAESWFGRVDAALYAAKEGGRNRVSVDRRGNSDAWAADTGVSVLRLEWQEAYECGEPTIDRQHRELFELANSVIAEAGAGLAPAPGGALDDLVAHIATHFRDEEALLAARGYEKLAAHSRAHARLLARSRELKDAAAQGGASYGAVVEFIAYEVVSRHLLAADRNFFPLFSPAPLPR